MFRLTVLSQEAKGGAPLSPILGQQQIKVQDFVADFNRRSNFVVAGIPLPCRVIKETSQKFSLQVCPPTYYTLVWGGVNSQTVSVAYLYDCLRFRNRFEMIPTNAKTLLGFVKSCRFKIKIN